MTAGTVSRLHLAAVKRCLIQAEARRCTRVGEAGRAVAAHALRDGKFLPEGRVCRYRARGRGAAAAARRGQHGDCCRYGHGARQPHGPVNCGLVIHPGLLKSRCWGQRVFLDVLLLLSLTPLYRMGGHSTVTENVTWLSPA